MDDSLPAVYISFWAYAHNYKAKVSVFRSYIIKSMGDDCEIAHKQGLGFSKWAGRVMKLE